MSRALLFVLLIYLSLPIQVSASVKIATDPWCPYVCEQPSPQPGLLVEIVEQALAENGYMVDFIWLNWARAITEARKGTVQGILGAYKTDSPDFTFGNEHLAYSSMCFYTRLDDEWQYDGLLSLTSRAVTVVNGYSYGAIFDSYLLNNENSGNQNITRVYGKDTIQRRLKLLEKNKSDTIVEDTFVMNKVNQDLEQNKQLRQAGCLPSEKLYLAFSPNSNLSPRLSRALDQGIRKLRKNGGLEKIMTKYR